MSSDIVYVGGWIGVERATFALSIRRLVITHRLNAGRHAGPSLVRNFRGACPTDSMVTGLPAENARHGCARNGKTSSLTRRMRGPGAKRPLLRMTRHPEVSAGRILTSVLPKIRSEWEGGGAVASERGSPLRRFGRFSSKCRAWRCSRCLVNSSRQGRSHPQKVQRIRRGLPVFV